MYVQLYSHRNTTDVDLKAMLPGTPNNFLWGQRVDRRFTNICRSNSSRRKMKNSKSPGPNGFWVELYTISFNDIGSLLVRSINYGFGKEELSVTQNQGVVTCIPKEGKPKQYVKNWHPISLLNTAYKIAKACIANRLKTMLPKLSMKIKMVSWQVDMLEKIFDFFTLQCTAVYWCFLNSWLATHDWLRKGNQQCGMAIYSEGTGFWTGH